MQARDASGRQVSLLNDESNYQSIQRPTYRTSSYSFPQSHRSDSNSPNTPELMRSDSYDSTGSSEAVSPLTPSIITYDYPRTALYPSAQSGYDDYDHPAKRPSFIDASSRSNSYDDDASQLQDRPGKRYPCRYRETHGCEKTFTTSGHASRHSKIHTAEKAVQCTFSACQKKFTRADNMKQHLETHYKDKSRSSLHRSATRQSSAALATAARRSSSSARTTSSTSSRSNLDQASWDSERYGRPLQSPGGAAWDMRDLNVPLLTRPITARTPSGLDALAMAIACQENA